LENLSFIPPFFCKTRKQATKYLAHLDFRPLLCLINRKPPNEGFITKLVTKHNPSWINVHSSALIYENTIKYKLKHVLTAKTRPLAHAGERK